MCREYDICFLCGHVTHDARLCARSVNCTNVSENIFVPIQLYCSICISEPTFPTWKQQLFIPRPEVDRLVAAQDIWSRLKRLYLGPPITDSIRNSNDAGRLDDPVPEEDLVQLRHWLQLLIESRSMPQTWHHPPAGSTDQWDKIVFIKLLETIVTSEIKAKEASFAFVADEGNDKQNLLTKVEMEDLDDDRKECLICTISYGHSPQANQEAEIPVQLPCGHVFGEACIAAAFEQLAWTCPYCRAPYDADKFVLNRFPKKIESPWWMEWLKHAEE